jgi:hypothetical protein
MFITQVKWAQNIAVMLLLWRIYMPVSWQHTDYMHFHSPPWPRGDWRGVAKIPLHGHIYLLLIIIIFEIYITACLELLRCSENCYFTVLCPAHKQRGRTKLRCFIYANNHACLSYAPMCTTGLIINTSSLTLQISSIKMWTKTKCKKVRSNTALTISLALNLQFYYILNI